MVSSVIHRALIVTTYDEKLIKSLHDFSIVESSHGGSIVTPVHRSPVNCYFTFVILPEGSGEGWEDSERAKEFRQSVVDEIRTHDDPEDGSNPFEWALVEYGSDLMEGEEA